MAPRTGVRLMFRRSASSASRIQVPGESRPCTISSRISRKAVRRLVPCSALARVVVDLLFFVDDTPVVRNRYLLPAHSIAFCTLIVMEIDVAECIQNRRQRGIIGHGI